MYEAEYFTGYESPIRFGYNSLFYRINAWFRFRKVIKLIRRFGGGGSVLDVGSALGHSLNIFRSLGLNAIGCDISAWATKRAKKLFKGVKIVRAKAGSLPFTESAFAITTSFETLEHCSSLNQVLEEISRVTKRGGLIILSVPTTDLNNVYGDNSHIWHLSLKEWLSSFERHFRVLNVEYFMRFMKYVDGKTCSTFIVLRNVKPREGVKAKTHSLLRKDQLEIRASLFCENETCVESSLEMYTRR